MTRWLAICVVVLGCGSSSDHPRKVDTAPCRDAIKRFTEQLRAMGPQDPPQEVAKAAACTELYSRPKCRKAWRRLAQGAEPAIGVMLTCGHEYCADLPKPRPAVCQRFADGDYDGAGGLDELDAAILAFDGVGLEAVVIASRASLFEGGIGEPPVPVLITPGARTVRIADGRLYLEGREVTRDELRQEIADSMVVAPAIKVVIESAPTEPYQNVVDVLDLIKTAGATSISLSTR